MKLLVKWTLEFKAVYCDCDGEHYWSYIETSAVNSQTKEAISQCWHAALESANSNIPAKDAVLIFLDLINSSVDNVRY